MLTNNTGSDKAFSSLSESKSTTALITGNHLSLGNELFTPVFSDEIFNAYFINQLISTGNKSIYV